MKTLFFSETGSVELLDSDGDQLWTSEGDQDFRDEFGDDFLDAEDTDAVCAFLIDEGELDEDEEIEVREGDLEDFGDDDDDDDGGPLIIEGELVPT